MTCRRACSPGRRCSIAEFDCLGGDDGGFVRLVDEMARLLGRKTIDILSPCPAARVELRNGFERARIGHGDLTADVDPLRRKVWVRRREDDAPIGLASRGERRRGMRRDRLFEDETTPGRVDAMRAVVREGHWHGDGVRALRSHVDVARPSLVVVVAVERQDRAGLARDAVTAVVVAALSIGGMNSWNVRGSAVRACMEVQPDDRQARREDRLNNGVRGEE